MVVDVRQRGTHADDLRDSLIVSEKPERMFTKESCV